MALQPAVAWDEANFEVSGEPVAVDAEHHDSMTRRIFRPVQWENQPIEAYPSAFPDATREIEDVLPEGDGVAVRTVSISDAAHSDQTYSSLRVIR